MWRAPVNAARAAGISRKSIKTVAAYISDGARTHDAIANWRAIEKSVRFYGLCFVALLLLLLLLDSSAIIAHFAYHDDYYYFAYDNHHGFKRHPQYTFILMIGRQLYAILATPIGWLIHGIADFSLVRCIYLVALAAGGVLIIRMLIRLQLQWWHAAATALGICLLPGAQLSVLWITGAPFAGVMIFALISGSCATAVAFDDLFASDRRARVIAGIIGAIAALVAALFIYPPWAMFYLVPVFAYLLLEPALGVQRLFAKIALTAFVFLCSVMIFFSFQKFVFEPIYRRKFAAGYAAMEQSGYNFKLSTDFSAKGEEFFQAGFDALNLWNIYPSSLVAAIILLVVLLGALVALRRLWHRLSFGEWALRAVGLVILLPAAVLPTLAAASANEAPYRVMLPLAAMLTIAVYVSIGCLWEALPLAEPARRRLRYTAVAVLTLLAACITVINIGMSSANSALEFRLLQSLVTEHVRRGEDLSRVHIVLLPEGGNSLLGLPCRFDEFNCNSLSSWADAPWMLRAALLELGVDRTRAAISLTKLDENPESVPMGARLALSTTQPGDPYNVPPGTVVFDMNDFAKPSPDAVMAHCCDFNLMRKRMGNK